MHRPIPVLQRAAVLLGVTVISPLLLTGCSGSGAADGPAGGSSEVAAQGADPGSVDSDDLRDSQVESGVPAVCLDAFPAAFGPADLSTVTLLPADWPTQTLPGTLCQTAATGSGIQTADWATDAAPAEVLDALTAALPSTYAVTREDKGMGEQLDGTAGDVYFTVRTRPGAWTLQLGPA